MSAKRRVQDDNYIIYTRGCIYTQKSGQYGEWLNGTVRTDWGIVEATNDPRSKYSRLDFVWKGRHYIRTIWGKAHTKAGLVRMAQKFAREKARARPAGEE